MAAWAGGLIAMSLFNILQVSLAAGTFLTNPAPFAIGSFGKTDPIDPKGNLAEWLQSLHVPIGLTVGLPPIEGVSLNLTIIECGKVSIDGIDHETHPDKGILHAKFKRTAFECSGSWLSVHSAENLKGDWSFKSGMSTFGATLEFTGAPSFLQNITIASNASTGQPLCSAALGSVDFEFTGGLPAPLRYPIERALDVLVEQGVQKAFCPGLAKVLGMLTPEFDKASTFLSRYTTMPPPGMIPPAPNDSVSLNTTQLLPVLREMLTKTLMNLKGPQGLNKLFADYEGKDIPVHLSLPVLPIPGIQVHINVSTVKFAGLTSFTHVDLLSLLSNQSIGMAITGGPFQIGMQGTVGVTGTGSQIELIEHLNIQMKASKVTMNQVMWVHMHESARNYKPEKWQAPACVAQALSGVGFQDLDLLVEGLETTISPVSGVYSLERDVAGLLDDTAELITSSWDKLLSHVTESVLAGPVREITNLAVGVGLQQEQAKPCDPDMSIEGGVNNGLSLGAGVAAGVSAVLGLLVMITLPKHATWAFPLLLLTSALLYVSEKSAHGSITPIRLTGADGNYIDLMLEDDSFFGVIDQLMSDHMYLMAYALIIFSGVVPFIRLITLAVFWYFSKLGGAKRSRILLLIDGVGKYMFLDSINFCIAQVGGFFEKDWSGTSLIMYSGTQWGLHGIILATILNIFAGDCLREMNRRQKLADEKKAYEEQARLDTEAAAVGGGRRGVSFEEPRAPVLDRVSLASKHPVRTRALVPMLLIAGAALFFAGWFSNCARFQFLGPAGKLLADPKVPKMMSLFSIARDAPSMSLHPEQFGVQWFRFVWVMLTFVCFAADLCVMAVLWLAPLTVKIQTRLAVAHCSFHCWAVVEVVLLGTLLATDDPKDNPDPILKAIGSKVQLEAGFWLLLLSVLMTNVTGLWMTGACDKLLEARRHSEMKLAPGTGAISNAPDRGNQQAPESGNTNDLQKANGEGQVPQGGPARTVSTVSGGTRTDVSSMASLPQGGPSRNLSTTS